MQTSGGRKLALALFWAGAMVAESVLAIHTFKVGPASPGMDADRAHALAVAWETVHLVLLAALIPGALLAAVWCHLRRSPIAEWRGGRIAVAWLTVPTMAWFALMTEIALVETILRVRDALVLVPMVGIYGLLTAAVVASTTSWKMRRALSWIRGMEVPR